MAIRYKNPQTGEYEVIKIPVMKGEQGHAGIHVGTDAPPTTDVKLWFDPSDTDNDVDLANRLDTTLIACYDYMGNDRGSVKAAADANVDWLLGEINTAHYEGQQITATDTIEGRSKSAILSGNTLVNLLTKSNIKITSSKASVIDYVYQLDTTKTYIIQYCINQLPELSDTSESGRAFKLEWYDGGLSKGHKNIYNKEAVVKRNTYIKIEPFSDNVSRTNFSVWCPNYTSGTLDIDIMIIEYQEGMENWDIPYFEGMQSVQMPVLTTVGKNLCKYRSDWVNNGLTFTHTNDGVTVNGTATTYVDYYVTTKSGSINTETLDVLNSLQVGTRVLLSNNLGKNSYISYMLNGETKYANNVTIQNGMEITGAFVRFQQGDICNNLNLTIQLEIGNEATSYEPHKSNVLSCNEEVTLRGIGNVKDELNLLTGELTERIGEIVLDGSEDEGWHFNKELGDGSFRQYVTTANLVDAKKVSQQTVISDKLVSLAREGNNNCIWIYDGGTIVIHSSALNVGELKTWLASNPITVQYRLSSESIKTVDLSDYHVYSYKDITHYACSSEDSSLIPTLSIDVPTNLSAVVAHQRNVINTLREENVNLNQELQLAITSSEENDNELLAQSFELDFRLMEVECALDLPMAATFRLGGKAMAMTPYEMAKKLILAGNYDRADMEHKLDVYVSKKRMTEAERQELIQLMDEKEGIISIDPVEPEVEESVIEHEAVTIPLH